MPQGGVGMGAPVERYRVALGREWWVAVVAVPAILGVIGAIGADRGFLSVFLWCVVAFCVGTVIALVAAALVVPAEADPATGSTTSSSSGRPPLRGETSLQTGERR